MAGSHKFLAWKLGSLYFMRWKAHIRKTGRHFILLSERARENHSSTRDDMNDLTAVAGLILHLVTTQCWPCLISESRAQTMPTLPQQPPVQHFNQLSACLLLCGTSIKQIQGKMQAAFKSFNQYTTASVLKTTASVLKLFLTDARVCACTHKHTYIHIVLK